MHYRIYGRKEYPQPLEQVGRMAAEDVGALREKALDELGTDGWVEMVAVPESAVISVISPSKEGGEA